MSGLEVDHASVSFGGRRALDEVSITAEPGQITGLIGPNGAGKTTLFNVVCGLQVPNAGRVLLGGDDVTNQPPYRRARLGLARTFQRLELFGLLTVGENVHLAARVSGQPSAHRVAEELLARLGLTEVAHVRSDRLSTGRARLVELARALAVRPRVLLLDEPASGQDERETAAFAEVLRGVAAEGVAVVLIEHDIQLVMDVCQVVHVLDLGALLASGPPAEVRRDQAVLAAYLGQAS